MKTLLSDVMLHVRREKTEAEWKVKIDLGQKNESKGGEEIKYKFKVTFFSY